MTTAPIPTRASLDDGRTHVVLLTLDLPAATIAALARSLSPDETERAARYHHERDRRRYVVGRAALRTILARCVDAEPAALRFAYGEHGKPSIADEGAGRIRFNASSSGERGIVAVRLDAEVGVDIEQLRRVPDALAIARRMFTPDEVRALGEGPADGLDAAFLGVWTRKEAVVKSIGRGLAQPMDSFALAVRPGASPERVDVAVDGGRVTRWLVPVETGDAQYVAALASESPPGTLVCSAWRATGA